MARRELPPDEVIEDLGFLDDTGVGATEAAQRTGFPSAGALEKWLERQGHYDLWLKFKHRDPEGAHSKETRRAESMIQQRKESLADVLAQADQSTRARTRNKAAKARSLIDELRTTLLAEREEDERRAEASKEIERLERELALAKAKLRGGSVSLAVSSAVSASELRAWARHKGIACPGKGRVPRAVEEAYAAEQDAA